MRCCCGSVHDRRAASEKVWRHDGVIGSGRVGRCRERRCNACCYVQGRRRKRPWSIEAQCSLRVLIRTSSGTAACTRGPGSVR